VAFGSSVLTHKKEQQIKIAGEFKPTVDCLCAIRRGFVAVYIEKVRSAEYYIFGICGKYLQTHELEPRMSL
jgi:hypothetical protein